MRNVLLAATAACALFTLPASATILVPPTADACCAPDLFPDLSSSATLLAESLNQAFTSNLGAADFSGVADTYVFSDPGNTFAPGDLTFFYLVFNNTGSTENLDRLTASDFTGFQTDVGYQTGGTGGGTIAPATVDRTSGADVGFNLSIPAGSGSFFLEIQTDATQFVPGHLSIIDSGVATVDAFAPSIPEPRTWLMVLLGFGLIGLVARKRKGTVSLFA